MILRRARQRPLLPDRAGFRGHTTARRRIHRSEEGDFDDGLDVFLAE
jgi:hypothetical protein